MSQLNLTLQEKINLSPDIASFVFDKLQAFSFDASKIKHDFFPGYN